VPSERRKTTNLDLVLSPSAGRRLQLPPSTTQTMMPSRLLGTLSARIITCWLPGPRGLVVRAWAWLSAELK